MGAKRRVVIQACRRLSVAMFSLNLSNAKEEPGSTQASARRVAPLSSRKSSRIQDIQAAKLDSHAQDDQKEEQSTGDDSSLDDFDLLYDSYSERSSTASEDYEFDGELASSGSDEGSGAEGALTETHGMAKNNDSDEGDGCHNDSDDEGNNRNSGNNGNMDIAGGRPPRLSLPSLEVPTALDDCSQRLGPPESARRVQFIANTSSQQQTERIKCESAKHTVKVNLLMPCFDLVLEDGEDLAAQVAEKFAVGPERVRVLLSDNERTAVELLGSSFSLVKLEEKMAENAALHARVAELERKLTSSEGLRLKAHRTLQELRREVDELEKYVCSKRPVQM